MNFEESQNSDKWACDKCGKVLDNFIGPASKKLAIDNHVYFEHERPARLREQWAAPPSRIFFTDWYLDGRDLTAFDKGFLKTCGACWNKPLDNQQPVA